MTVYASPNVFVYICNPKARSSILLESNDSNSNGGGKGKAQKRKEEDDDDEEEEELERDVMLVSRLSSTPYIVSTTNIKVQGSDTNILFHHGCIKSGSLVHTLGEKAWDELWRNGSFWLLSCYSPVACGASNPSELYRDVFGYNTHGIGAEVLLEYLVHRLFDASLTLKVAILQWTEEENDDGRQKLEEVGGEFNDSRTMINFVQSALQGMNALSAFHFALLSISFTDPTSERTCEVVLASASANIAEMSSLTSSALVTVRSLFANIASTTVSRTREEYKDEFLQRDLKSWAAPVVPPALTNFLFTRLYRWRHEEELERVGPVPPQAVYTLLEVPPLEMETDTIAVTRYLSFWCTLGSLVVGDAGDSNEANADGNKGPYDPDNAHYHSHIANADQDTSENNRHNGSVISALQEAKDQFLRLFVDPIVAPLLLLRPLPFTNALSSTARSRLSSNVVVGIEEMHKRELATRQAGLQRKVRRILSSSRVEGKKHKFVESAVSAALKHYAVETQALQWRQRLEWRYYTNDIGPLLLPPPVSEEKSDSVRSKDKTGKSSKEAVHVTSEVLVEPSRTTRQSVSQCVLLHGIMGPRNPLQRLAEVEMFRRLLIKHDAAQSMQSVLVSSLLDSRQWHVQLAQEHTNEVRKLLCQYKVATDHLESLQFFTEECHTCDVNMMFKALQEKVEYFTNVAMSLCESNGLRTDESSEVHRMESVSEHLHVVSPCIVVHKETQTETMQNEFIPEIESEPQNYVSHVDHDFVQSVSALSNTSAQSSSSISTQWIEDLEPTQAIEEVSSTTVTINTPDDPLSARDAEGRMNAQTRIFLQTVIPSYSDEILDTASLDNVTNDIAASKTNIETTCAVVEHELFPPAAQPHRLRRKNASDAHSPAYRQLLSTGGSGPDTAKHRQKAGGRLPALSFSDITREQEQWNGAGDLDDYRGLLAYRLYLVGPAGCGKSSLAHCVAHAQPIFARLPVVEPHTMRMRHSAIRILDVNLQQHALPLGGCDPTNVANVQRLTESTSTSATEPCRVGVDIVEVPTPMLHASSVGHVKLPARAAVYCVLYRAQDEWEKTVTCIWQYVRMLQSAMARPSPHVAQWMMGSSLVDVPLPIVLIGTHSDTLTASNSASDTEGVMQQRMHRLDVWFEQQVREQAGSAEAAGWPRPLLISSYMTSALQWTVMRRKGNGAKTFRSLLESTLQFMHFTAPLSPPHVLARWLPTHLRALIYEDGNNGDEKGKKSSSDEKLVQGTLEGFWLTLCDRRKSRNDETFHSAHGETESLEGLHNEHEKQRTLQQWMRRNTAGLLVLFTALQRLRSYVSCCFDEQSMDNAVLYHLGFVAPDDSDDSTAHSLLCMRDIIVEALLEECRLRGVLLFLPLLPCTTPSSPPQASRMVTIGPQWVESLWAQTLAPRMVIHHVTALTKSGAARRDDALLTVLHQCERQISIALPAAYFAALCPQTTTGEAQGGGEEMHQLFAQYFAKGHVTLALLQLLWRSPYGVLALRETHAAMALAACGLLSLTEESAKLMEAHTNPGLPFYLPCVALECEESVSS